MTVSEIVTAGIVLVFAALFAAAALTRGPFGAKSRVAMLGAALEAVLGLALGWALIPWSAIGAGWWLVPVAVTAAGAAGTVVAWGELPWRRPRKGERPAGVRSADGAALDEGS